MNEQQTPSKNASCFAPFHAGALLQRVIDAGRIAIEPISYELAWGEDSAEDSMAYQEPSTPGATK